MSEHDLSAQQGANSPTKGPDRLWHLWMVSNTCHRGNVENTTLHKPKQMEYRSLVSAVKGNYIIWNTIQKTPTKGPGPSGLPAWCFLESRTGLQNGSSSKLLCHRHSGSVSYHCKQCSVWPALLGSLQDHVAISRSTTCLYISCVRHLTWIPQYDHECLAREPYFYKKKVQ